MSSRAATTRPKIDSRFIGFSSLQLLAASHVGESEQEEVVAMRRILIADRVTGIPRYLRADLEHDTRREIAGTVLASKPIGGECDFLVQWLFKTELPTCAIRGSNHISSEVVPSGSHTSAAFESLAE